MARIFNKFNPIQQFSQFIIILWVETDCWVIVGHLKTHWMCMLLAEKKRRVASFDRYGWCHDLFWIFENWCWSESNAENKSAAVCYWRLKTASYCDRVAFPTTKWKSKTPWHFDFLPINYFLLPISIFISYSSLYLGSLLLIIHSYSAMIYGRHDRHHM